MLSQNARLARAFSEATRAFAQENQRVRAILEGLGNAVFVLREDGVIEDVNPAAVTMFEYPPEDLVGTDLSALMPEAFGGASGEFLQYFEGRAQSRGLSREMLGRTRSGRELPIEVLFSAARHGDTRRLIAVVNDISERKAADRRMASLMNALARTNAELDQFAYVASHDLKAPLRVIDNASQWLAEDLDQHLTDDTRESLEMLRGRVRRMERLLDDLLEHSRIGREKKPVDIVSGRQLASAVLALVDAPQKFEIVFDDKFLTAKLPRLPFQTIFLNLIENSIRHHDATSGHVDVSLDDSGAEIVFSITDDGPGIPEKYHDKVFEMFQTLARRDEVDASGMGLAIVRKHAEVAGGAVRIQPDDGRGTTILIEWPKCALPGLEKELLAS